MNRPGIRLPLQAFLRTALLASLPLVLASPSPAQGSQATLLGMFPKQMNDFGYADMKTARSFPWFEQVQKELLPPNLLSFENFITSTALSANSQVNELYWGEATIPNYREQVVGVAIGQFDVTETEDHLKAIKIPSIEYQGFDLFAFGTGLNPTDMFFFFIDSDTAAFGQRAALQQFIDVRTGAADSFLQNDSLYPLVNAEASNTLLWAILDRSSAQSAMQDFFPEAGQFPQLTAVRDRLKALTIQLDAPFSTNEEEQLNITFTAVCGSPDDANLIAAAMQFALMYRRNQPSAGNSGVASILDTARVTPRGDALELRLSLNQQQILAFVLAGAPQQR